MRLVIIVSLSVALLAFNCSEASAQKKKPKQKAFELEILTQDFKKVPTCDGIYLPWYTDIDEFIKELKKSGVKEIKLDTFNSIWRSYWVRCSDEYYKYDFSFDSLGHYQAAHIECYFKNNLGAERAFREYSLSASINFQTEDEKNYDSPREKKYRHKCARFLTLLTLYMEDDTTVQFMYTVIPLANLLEN